MAEVSDRTFAGSRLAGFRAGGYVALMVLLALSGCSGKNQTAGPQKVAKPTTSLPGVVRVSPSVQTRILISKSVPGSGLFELTQRTRQIWVKGEKGTLFGEPSYLYSLKWTRSEESPREYCIAGPRPRLSLGFELRATRDHTRLWLVSIESYVDGTGERSHAGIVLCSLDTRTGEFLNLNGYPMDPRLPLEKQEAESVKKSRQNTYPDCATPTGGVLLGEFRY